MKLQVNIDVDDLEQGIAFYQSALGFTLRRRLFDGTVAEMTGGSSSVYLLTRPVGSSASPNVSAPRDYRRHWTPCTWTLRSRILKGRSIARCRVAPSWKEKFRLSNGVASP